MPWKIMVSCSALPHLRAYVPAFDDDVRAMIELCSRFLTPRTCASASPKNQMDCGSRLRPLETAPGRAGLGDPGGRPAGRRNLDAVRSSTRNEAGPLVAQRTSLDRIPDAFLADLARSRSAARGGGARGPRGRRPDGRRHTLLDRRSGSRAASPVSARAMSRGGTAPRSSTAANAGSIPPRSSSFSRTEDA